MIAANISDIRGEFIETPTKNTERLLDIKSNVDFDGSVALFGLQFTSGPPIHLAIDNSDMMNIFGHIRHVSALMLGRQRLRLDRGSSGLMELMTTAPRPAQIDVVIDPMTFDRLFLFQFFDQAPVAIRVSAVECQTVRTRVGTIIASISN